MLSVRDGAAIIGMTLIATGLALWSVALALVVVGALLLAAAVYGTILGTIQRERH